MLNNSKRDTVRNYRKPIQLEQNSLRQYYPLRALIGIATNRRETGRTIKGIYQLPTVHSSVISTDITATSFDLGRRWHLLEISGHKRLTSLPQLEVRVCIKQFVRLFFSFHAALGISSLLYWIFKTVS